MRCRLTLKVGDGQATHYLLNQHVDLMIECSLEILVISCRLLYTNEGLRASYIESFGVLRFTRSDQFLRLDYLCLYQAYLLFYFLHLFPICRRKVLVHAARVVRKWTTIVIWRVGVPSIRHIAWVNVIATTRHIVSHL